MFGKQICPASAKVHTTMHKAETVYTEDDTQIIFMDTPGLVTNYEMKKYKLAETFKEDPMVSIKEADVIGIIQDATNAYTRHKINNFVMEYLQNKREDTSLILIFNKVDKIKKKSILLELTKLLTKPESSPKFDDIFMISALTGDGIDDLRVRQCRSFRTIITVVIINHYLYVYIQFHFNLHRRIIYSIQPRYRNGNMKRNVIPIKQLKI